METFDFQIFTDQQMQQQSYVEEEGQVGGSKIGNEDMAPYTVFQRFCVLLLSLHGQVEKYDDRSGEENKESDTT